MRVIRLMRLALGLACSLGAAACSTFDVHSDYDPQTNFVKYKTFTFAPQPSPLPSASDATGLPSDLVDSRIRSNIEAQLRSKGLRPADTDEAPDLVVDYRLIHKDKIESSGSGYLGFGYGGYGYGPFGGFGFPVYPWIRQYIEGILVIDLTDAKSNRLAWRGVASETLDTEEDANESAKNVGEAVAETLKKFPPTETGQG